MPTKKEPRNVKTPLTTAVSPQNKDQVSDLSAQLAERFAEVATLSRMLSEAERESSNGNWRFEWLVKVAPMLHNQLQSRGKFGLIAHDNQKLLDKLKREGLFDCAAYLNANPDVREAGLDPLHHFLQHGIVEGRSLGL